MVLFFIPSLQPNTGTEPTRSAFLFVPNTEMERTRSYGMEPFHYVPLGCWTKHTLRASCASGKPAHQALALGLYRNTYVYNSLVKFARPGPGPWVPGAQVRPCRWGDDHGEGEVAVVKEGLRRGRRFSCGGGVSAAINARACKGLCSGGGAAAPPLVCVWKGSGKGKRQQRLDGRFR